MFFLENVGVTILAFVSGGVISACPSSQYWWPWLYFCIGTIFFIHVHCQVLQTPQITKVTRNSTYTIFFPRKIIPTHSWPYTNPHTQGEKITTSKHNSYVACCFVNFVAAFSNSFGLSLIWFAILSSKGWSGWGFSIISFKISAQLRTFNVGPQFSFTTSLHISPDSRDTFGWYILVAKVILGGLKGYCAGKWKLITNVPPA